MQTSSTLWQTVPVASQTVCNTVCRGKCFQSAWPRIQTVNLKFPWPGSGHTCHKDLLLFSLMPYLGYKKFAFEGLLSQVFEMYICCYSASILINLQYFYFSDYVQPLFRFTYLGKLAIELMQQPPYCTFSICTEFFKFMTIHFSLQRTFWNGISLTLFPKV